MDLRSFVGALAKQWWVILLGILLGAAVAVGLLARATPMYASTTSFIFNTTDGSPASRLSEDQFAQSRVQTYVYLLSSENLAQLILNDTHLQLTPTQVASKISGTSPLNTALLTATVVDSSPARSLLLAQSLAKQFPVLVAKPDPTVLLTEVSPPTLNPHPVSPKKTLDLGIGVLLGLFLGVVAATLRELFNTTARSGDRLREMTDLPVFGSLAYDKKARRSPLASAVSPGSPAWESYRQLRINLHSATVDRPSRTLSFTSSVAGEGASSIASGLAIALAEAGQSVVLIDADLRHPKLADYLGLDGSYGLVDVLTHQVPVADMLQPWGQHGLEFLASGNVPPNPSELLGSEAMSELLAELRGRADIVLLDTPPTLPVADARVVAAQVDGVMFVVRAGKTRQDQIRHALDGLRAVNASVLGCTLTMVPRRRRSQASYYGYVSVPSTAPGEFAASSIEAVGGAPADHESTQPGRPRKMRLAPRHRPS